MRDVAIETDHPTNVSEASDALAEVFRTGAVGDVFTEDVFLDGHPPFWRFQIQGRDAFAEWLRGDVTVAVGAAETAFRQGGGRAVYDDSPLPRRLRDLETIAQHFLVRPDTMTTAGAAMLGQPLDTPVF